MLLRWGLRIAVLCLALVSVQVGLLAFPQLLLSKAVESGAVIVHYRGNPGPEIVNLTRETDHRLQAGGFGNPQHPERVFFFADQGVYSLFARLARVPPDAQGFGVSFLGNSFVSGPRVRALGERTGHTPRYSVWEGSVSHTMAHEVAHLILIDSIGRKRWLALPHWKQEGLPEYMANIGLIQGDPTASLQNRIGILLDDHWWPGARSWDRIHYEAGLLVEFLLDVRGMDLREVLDDEVARDRTYSEMMEWGRTGAEQRRNLPDSPRTEPPPFQPRDTGSVI